RLFIYSIRFFSQDSAALHDLHSFPTRRSSDLYLTNGGVAKLVKQNCGSAFVSISTGAMIGRHFTNCWSLRASMRKPSMGSIVCRSEEHTSELQSRGHLVCRLLLEKKKLTTGFS